MLLFYVISLLNLETLDGLELESVDEVDERQTVVSGLDPLHPHRRGFEHLGELLFRVPR